MKEKIIAALLAFFLGTWGIHKFYLNEQETGKKYLIWCIVGILTSWFFVGLIPLVVLCVKSLIDCFTILFMSDQEFNEKYNKPEPDQKKEILTD